MIRVAAVPHDVALERFSNWLWQQGVHHEIEQDAYHQVLWIEGEHLREPVLNALSEYMEDPASRRSSASEAPPRRQAVVGGHWQASPGQAKLTLGLIILAGIVAWLSGFGARDELVAALTIVNPFEYMGAQTLDQRLDALASTLAQGQVWRLFTPDILHFGVSHLVFNAVMLWYLGSQIEVLDGKGHWVGVVVISSLAANIPQYLLTGPLFGGLSGVVYAVLGYVWIANRFRPTFMFPPALMTVAVVWLLIGFTPLTEALLGASMANAAHLGGLMAGLAYGGWLYAGRTR